MFIPARERIELGNGQVATVCPEHDGVYTTFSAVRFKRIGGETVFYASSAMPGGWTRYSSDQLLEKRNDGLSDEEAMRVCRSIAMQTMCLF